MTDTGDQDTSVAQGPDMTWTSFDRFGRYTAVVSALRDRLDPGATVVDVGDGSGHLQQFAPEMVTVAIDPSPSPDPFPESVRVQADGTRLPLDDRAVDAVVTCDALEHVEQPRRAHFLEELMRVARKAVVLTAPFDTHGVSGVEELVARYAHVVGGEAQPQLTEHAAFGLPQLADTAGVLTGAGWDVEVRGEGNLFDWLGAMLLRLGAEGRSDLRPLADGFDLLYNRLLASRTGIGPFYRHVLVAWPSGSPSGTVTYIDGGPDSVVAAGTDGVGSAMLSQITLLDLVPRIAAIDETTAGIVVELDNRLEGAVRHIDDGLVSVLDRLGGIEAEQQRLRERINHLAELLEHDLSSRLKTRARAKLRRWRSG